MTGATESAEDMAAINMAVAIAPDWLRPLYRAVRDDGACLMLVHQGRKPFTIPETNGRTPIAMILDDTDRSVGPDGFYLPATSRMIRASDAFAVVSSAPVVLPYAAMATIAATGRAVMIIETLPEHELQWIALIKKLVPNAKVIVSTVKGGQA